MPFPGLIWKSPPTMSHSGSPPFPLTEVDEDGERDRGPGPRATLWRRANLQAVLRARSERPGLKHDLGGVCCSSSHLTRIGEDSSIRITFWVSSHTPLELFLPPETLSSSPRVRGSSLPLHPSSLSLTPTSRSSGHSQAGRVVFRVALEAETR